MAEYTISKIKLPNGDICNIKDTNTWRGIQDNLTSSSNTTESLSAKQGYLLANGSARDSTKVNKSGDRMTGDLIIGETSSDGTVISSGSFKIGAKNDNYGIMPFANNWNSIGSSSLHWYRSYVMNYYGTTSYITNWASNNNIGTAASSSAASVKGLVNFYNECAVGGTQTKTALQASATNNITLTLPNATGTLALTSSTITGNAANVTGTVAVDHGGTGATTPAGARTNLELGTMATETAANYLKLSGGTMTGVFTAKGSQYDDSITSSTSHAINMNNSNIIGLNAIYTADASDGAAEGINFYRDATHFDTLWMSGGDLLFVPNRALGTNTTKANSQKVGRFTANPTTDQVIIADGTTGGMKSSGYTIAKSVPSDAKFTDTTYSAGTGISLSGTTFSNSGVTSIAGKTGAVTLADLGLSQALRFIGITSTSLSDGATTSTLVAKSDGSLIKTTGFVTGDVVIDINNAYEYVWTGSAWERLGGDSSYKTTQTAFTNSTGSADGTNTSASFIYSFSQTANGNITDIKTRTLPIASSSVAGITTVGASGGAAAYSHTHSYLANTNTGAADRPIYITGNAPAQTTYRMSGTNTAATTAMAITADLPTGNWYVNGTADIYSQSDGVVYAEQYNSSWIHEIYGDYRTGQIAVRGKNNGTWQAWRKILDSSNYTSYTVTKTGTGASGSWGINVTGSSASCTGNAATATAFSANKSVTLTGDVIGSASSTGGWSIATTLANSGATAGSYGDSAAQTPGYGATFKVPYITVDAKGRVTAISEHTVKIPASDNTDTKNTAGSTNSTSKLFLIGATTRAANPTTNSYEYTYTNNGLLSALKVGLNLNGTEKAHLEWNNTDQSIDFIFE